MAMSNLLPRVGIWATSGIFWRCLFLVVVIAFPAAVPAQGEDAVEYDEFNEPKLSPKMIGVVEGLKGVNYELIFTEDKKSAIGIHFGTGAKQGRIVEQRDLENLPITSVIKKLMFAKKIEVTDKWLTAIAKHRQLEGLWISECEITPLGLASLAKLSLLAAGLHGCKLIDDEAMETVADWEKLQHLRLSNLPITDEGIHIIRGLTSLETLDISYSDYNSSKITNKSIEVLQTFSKLRELRIDGTQIDDAGAAALKEALPKCDIIR